MRHKLKQFKRFVTLRGTVITIFFSFKNTFIHKICLYVPFGSQGKYHLLFKQVQVVDLCNGDALFPLREIMSFIQISNIKVIISPVRSAVNCNGMNGIASGVIYYRQRTRH
jgi:hypothetical protein